MSYGRYLSYLFVVTLVCALAFGGFNWFIDPYGFYGSPRFAAINAAKPDMGLHERPLKSYEIAGRQFDGLVFGASRSDVGLDPRHPGWTTTNNYNAAVGAITMELAYHYYQHARHFHTPQQVVLGLEFAMFNSARADKIDFDRNLLAVDLSGRRNPQYVPYHRLAMSLSPDMLRSSVDTLLENRNNPKYRDAGIDYELAIDERGMMNPKEFPINRWLPHRRRFTSTVESYLRRWWYPWEAFALEQNGSENPELNWYRQFLRAAHEDEADLRLLLSPVHAYMPEAKLEFGLYETWQDWKRALVAINVKEAARAGREPFDLWDFSGYTTYMVESISETNKKKETATWYWDPGHYRRELGDRMLDQIFDLERDTTLDSGVQLTAASIEAHLQETEAAAARYREARAAEIAELTAALRETVAQP